MHEMNPFMYHSNRKAYNWLLYNIGEKCLEKHVSLYKGKLYDLGCGEASYKDFFLQYCLEYVGVDWAKSHHNIKADLLTNLNRALPIESGTADTVVSLAVLEHLSEPQTMLNEAYRILRPGGAILLQVPWQLWIHEAPYDYFRYTPYGLRYLLEKAGFVDIKVEPQGGFFTMITTKLNYFSLRFIRGPKTWCRVVKAALFPLWYFGQLAAPLLDKLDRNWALECFAYCVTAEKPGSLPHSEHIIPNACSRQSNKTGDKMRLMRCEQLRIDLYSNIIREARSQFGITDLSYLMNVTNKWFDDSRNDDGRWAFIAKTVRNVKVLDMAAGCGTFVLYGLRHGKDVWGVEPEKWKLDYFRKKIDVSGYPQTFKDRVIPAFGEVLPFKDDTFDLVTSYQTLEHVTDVKRCLMEMLRVLKPGGSLFVRAPDYTSFFEGHYRIFFLPKMPRPLARFYLKMRRRPVNGLYSLNYVTERQLIRLLKSCGHRLSVDKIMEEAWRRKLMKHFPALKPQSGWIRVFLFLMNLNHGLQCLITGRERSVLLWITKRGNTGAHSP